MNQSSFAIAAIAMVCAVVFVEFVGERAMFAAGGSKSLLRKIPRCRNQGACGSIDKPATWLTSGPTEHSIAEMDAEPIPQIVWQTWRDALLPEPWHTHREDAIARNPGWRFEIVTDSQAAEFIREHFAGPVADAYFSINPQFGAMRADLWRYCVLLKHGGVYIDLDSVINKPLDQWIGKNRSTALISSEHKQWSRSQSQCRGVLASIGEAGLPAINMTWARGKRKPLTAVGELDPMDCSLVQWMLIFPPAHPVMEEAVRLATAHVHAWVGYSDEAPLPLSWWPLSTPRWLSYISSHV